MTKFLFERHSDGENVNVLHVDDNSSFLDLMFHYLKKQVPTLHLDSCDSPKKVFTLIQKQQYSLIILDYQMPYLNGIELLQLIHMVQPEISFVLLSSFLKQDAFARKFKQKYNILGIIEKKGRILDNLANLSQHLRMVTHRVL